MSCLGTVIEPTLLSQKIQQTNGHQKTQLLCSSVSEKTLANHIILKLFWNTITIHWATQTQDLSDHA